MKILICTILIIGLNFHYVELMSEAQMKSTAKLMRNVCQPKNKVSSATIDDMHKGIWDDSKEAQCYMLCTLLMMKAVNRQWCPKQSLVNKQGVLDYDFAVKQISTLPQRYQEPTRETMGVCRNTQTTDDACLNGYELAKCMYFRAPEFYFLP